MFAPRSPRGHIPADLRFGAPGTMSDMSSASRAAGYVVLTTMAAGLEILRHGWNETHTDDPADDDLEPADAR